MHSPSRASSDPTEMGLSAFVARPERLLVRSVDFSPANGAVTVTDNDLLDYFRNRQALLIEPDVNPPGGSRHTTQLWTTRQSIPARRRE